MSGTVSPTGGMGAPSAGFAISDGTRGQLLNDAQAFSGLVGSGNSSAAMGSLQTLTNDTQAAVTSYYGQNASGLNATSLRDLNGALAQMAQVGMKLSTGGGATEASQFANTMAQALSPETAPTATAPTAGAGGTGPASATPGAGSAASAGDASGGTQQVMQELMQVLEQLLQTMGGGQAAGGKPGAEGAPTGGAASGPQGPGATGAPASPAQGAAGGGQEMLQMLMQMMQMLMQLMGSGGAQSA